MTQRQETNYEISSEEYKKKHNKQKTKQYDLSPSNVGDKFPADKFDSAGDNDLYMGSW